jgi:predicted nucleotidyltransferase component of viral defense system
VIREQAIIEWRKEAPWSADAMVEQDLIISRALVEIYSVPDLASRLAFRGGTALYKLHLRPAARYSEDIDLVQVHTEPIGDTLNLLRAVLDPWLGEPQRKFKEGRVNLNYRFDSADTPPIKMKLKIEINSREHFTKMGLIEVPFAVESQWFCGQAGVTTFPLDELLGTKLRALYQRKKGRDLFDLWCALDGGKADPAALIACFNRYMAEEAHTVTRALFEANLNEKSRRVDFRHDMDPLLRGDLSWSFDEALKVVLTELIARLPGDPWKGDGGEGR